MIVRRLLKPVGFADSERGSCAIIAPVLQSRVVVADGGGGRVNNQNALGRRVYPIPRHAHQHVIPAPVGINIAPNLHPSGEIIDTVGLGPRR